MEDIDPISQANVALDERIAAKEAQLKDMESRNVQLRILIAEEEAFVQRLRVFIQEAEQERTRLQHEFLRLVPTR